MAVRAVELPEAGPDLQMIVPANEGNLDATTVDGDDTQIAFNGRYLRDALEAIDTPEVVLQITGPSSPGIIKPAGEPNGYLHVIMPMHVAR